MQRLKKIFHTLAFYTSVVCLFLSIHGMALAKSKKEAEEASSASAEEGTTNLWLMGYFLVGLGITLGMLVLCRSSRRSERAKPQGYKGLTTNE